MIKTQKIHPALVFGVSIIVYCMLLMAVLWIGSTSTKTTSKLNLENRDVKTIVRNY